MIRATPHQRGTLMYTFIILIFASSFTVAVPPKPQSPARSTGETSLSTGRAPRIIEHPSDLIVPRNEPATLHCRADGIPNPQISWFKDHGELVGSLSASHVPDATATRKLDVEAVLDPRIVQQNGALFFTRVLHNRKGSRTDSGIYYCTAANQFGEVRSNNATLQVAYIRDDFRRQLNVTILSRAGESTQLDCNPPRGFPTPKIYWKTQDGKQVKATGRFTLTGEGNLLIDNVKAGDAGDYTCAVENLAGIRESAPVTLRVLSAPSMLVPPHDITALADDNIVLECKARGYPEPIISWRRNDSRRALYSNRITSQEPGILRISHVTINDEGVYICQAENIIGSTTIGSATVTVHTRPTFIVPPQDQRVVVNADVSLDCLTSGIPAPAVFWTREGSQALMFPNQPNGRFLVQSDGTLSISNVKKEDAGNLVCSALSVAGSAIAKVKLEISEVAKSPFPVILVGPANQTLAISSVAFLPCRASGTPSIRWTKDGDDVTAERHPRARVLETGTLQISDLRISDSGIYTCVASSVNGRSTWSAGLIVDSPANGHVMFHRMPDISSLPDAPSKPQIDNVTDNSVELTWKSAPSSHSDSNLSKLYTVEYFAFDNPKGWIVYGQPTSANQIVISSLRPDSSYVFLVRTLTTAGLSQPSPLSDTIRTMNTARPMPDYDLAEIRLKFSVRMVQLLEVQPSSSVSLTIVWKVIQDEKLIAGYYVKYREHMLFKGNYSTVTFHRGSGHYSYTLFGLKKFTQYEVTLIPFYKDVQGRDSNVLIGQTLSDVPDAPPENVRVSIINTTTLQVNWHPPAPTHVNGNLNGYRLLIIPTGGGPQDNEAHVPVYLIKNVSSTEENTLSETVSNLVSGMRYRITVAARTDAGLGLSSRPLYVRMERPVSGTVDLFQEPWFIGVLSSVLVLCMLAVGVLFLIRRRQMTLQQKAAKLPAYNLPGPYLPYIRPSESGALLPNSIMGFPFVPATAYTDQRTSTVRASDWSSVCATEVDFRSHGCQLSNRMFVGNDQVVQYQLPECPVHGTMRHSHNISQERLAKVETGESSLSSYHSHMYSNPETASVHSRHSSFEQGKMYQDFAYGMKAYEDRILMEWKQFLPPPPRYPPSLPSTDKNSPTSEMDENHEVDDELGDFDFARRLSDLRQQYELALRIRDSQNVLSPLDQQSPGLHQNDILLRRGVQQRFSIISSQRPRSLIRTRSCDSCVNNEDVKSLGGSSDDQTDDVKYIDDGVNETSPCLSSEASFFLEKPPRQSTQLLRQRYSNDLTRTSEAHMVPHHAQRVINGLQKSGYRADNNSEAGSKACSTRPAVAEKPNHMFSSTLPMRRSSTKELVTNIQATDGRRKKIKVPKKRRPKTVRQLQQTNATVPDC